MHVLLFSWQGVHTDYHILWLPQWDRKWHWDTPSVTLCWLSVQIHLQQESLDHQQYLDLPSHQLYFKGNWLFRRSWAASLEHLNLFLSSIHFEKIYISSKVAITKLAIKVPLFRCWTPNIKPWKINIYSNIFSKVESSIFLCYVIRVLLLHGLLNQQIIC